MRFRLLVSFAVFCVSAAFGGAAAWAHPAADPYQHDGSHLAGFPDLASEPVDNVLLHDYEFGGSTGFRRLLRFNGYIRALPGGGSLEIRGTEPAAGSGSITAEMATISQRVYNANGTSVDHARPSARFVYETGDGHEHWHLRDAAQYSVVRPGDNTFSAPSAKVGFCFIDSQHDQELGRGAYISTEWNWDSHTNCGEPNGTGPASVHGPGATSTVMGLTPGWRDTYGADLWYQWVDVSNLLPGDYRVSSKVDPSNYVLERDQAAEANPPSTTDVRIPGYLANPVTVSDASRTAPTDIVLSTQRIDSTLPQGEPTTGQPGSAVDVPLAAPQFRIDEAPSNGDLNVPTGQWVSLNAATVRYTPRAGRPASDTFTYSVREAGSAFPLAPSRAQVAITTEEMVTVSGAPEMLYTGTSAQLAATVSNPRGSSAVTWRVNGVLGGNDAVGKVTPAGLYTAPAQPATVTITATSASNAIGSTGVRVESPPARQPAPTTQDPPPVTLVGPGPTFTPPTTVTVPQVPTTTPKTTTPAAPAMRSLRVARRGRYAVVSFVPGRNARAQTALRSRGKTLTSCSTKVTSGRPYTCRLTLRRGAKGLTVRVTLRQLNGTKLAERSVRVPAAR